MSFTRKNDTRAMVRWQEAGKKREFMRTPAEMRQTDLAVIIEENIEHDFFDHPRINWHMGSYTEKLLDERITSGEFTPKQIKRLEKLRERVRKRMRELDV